LDGEHRFWLEEAWQFWFCAGKSRKTRGDAETCGRMPGIFPGTMDVLNGPEILTAMEPGSKTLYFLFRRSVPQ